MKVKARRLARIDASHPGLGVQKPPIAYSDSSSKGMVDVTYVMFMDKTFLFSSIAQKSVSHLH